VCCCTEAQRRRIIVDAVLALACESDASQKRKVARSSCICGAGAAEVSVPVNHLTLDCLRVYREPGGTDESIEELTVMAVEATRGRAGWQQRAKEPTLVGASDREIAPPESARADRHRAGSRGGTGPRGVAARFRGRGSAVAACAVAFAVVACLPSAAQAADGWSHAASMSTARSGHTATVLANGKVLVTGGSDASGIVASAELYDPVSETWSPTASMHDARANHTATLLTSGKVLVAGGDVNSNGSTEPLTASAELYDPASATWSPAGSLGEIRAHHTATLLANGEVLVTGGDGSYDLEFGHGFPSSAERYDPVSNTWSPAADMSRPRWGLTATLLAGGKVLVAGGLNDRGGDPADAELYDPASDTWSSAASMTTPRSYHVATLLAGGKVLVSGGANDSGVVASAELYDPTSGTWSPAGTMSTARYRHAATLLSSGKVLVSGGDRLRENGTVLSDLTASSELYDPGSHTWSPAASMRTARADHRATLLPNGKVLVAGGFTASDGSPGEVSASVELFGGTAVAAPQTTIMSGPSGVTADRTPSFVFRSSAAGSSFACSLDQGVVRFSSCRSGVTFGPLVDGSYTFRVRATDAAGHTDATPATRTFTVRAAPRAAGDAYTTDLGATLVVAAPGVLRNDSDPNGDALHALLVSGPAHGTLTLNANGSLRYTPAEDYIGTDAFTYKASDGSQRSAAATVRLTVRAVCGGLAATKVGTSAANTLTGTAGADVIVGLGGNDTIRGLAGNDRVCGGSGADLITGGSGNDIVIGGSGNDVLRGEAGHDRLFGGAGADILFGGDGDDRLDGGANSPDSCQGGPGSDTVADSCERVS
jgi:Ca2+-binding RTX toxin-like protein/predicted lipoprotein with Yx(FWY)xxD motif